MKKVILYIFSAVLLGSIMVGCMPKDELTYTGPTVVEFKNHLQGFNTTKLAAMGVSSTGQTMVSRRVNVNTRGTDTIYVQLVGPQSASATEIGFAVETSSTAVAGTHYNFRPVGANKLTIPANSSTGYILVDMIPGSIAGTATFPLRVTLTGNGTVAPSANYKTFTLTLGN
ncbi:hypothetical protein [Nubsella zeaxanthinifaciens]|uniref:hypothetical protein n=1 Tax=Nubsella zeaxanthinifaciens TaxID=392412 RepID=UPI000DE467C0|nr:hypothetical protein [Nubsella zeaxanthinifaciens]